MSVQGTNLGDRYLRMLRELGTSPSASDELLARTLDGRLGGVAHVLTSDRRDLIRQLADIRYQRFADGMTWYHFGLSTNYFKGREAAIVEAFLQSGDRSGLTPEIDYKLKDCEAWAIRIERGVSEPTFRDVLWYAAGVGVFVNFDLTPITDDEILERLGRKTQSHQ